MTQKEISRAQDAVKELQADMSAAKLPNLESWLLVNKVSLADLDNFPDFDRGALRSDMAVSIKESRDVKWQ